MSDEIGVVERDLGDVDSYVEVEGKDEDTAVLLLEAAERAGLPPEVVRTTSDGFLVPPEVADAAGVEYVEPDADPLDFSTRADAEAYAEENGIEIEGASGMKADEYKKAVRKAAEAKGV